MTTHRVPPRQRGECRAAPKPARDPHGGSGNVLVARGAGRTRLRTLRLGLAAWVVLALLLKAALPLLASQAAAGQGKGVHEVCTAYGVATVALADDGEPTPADPAVPYAGEHCPVGAALLLPLPTAQAAALVTTATALRWLRPARQAPPPQDASARWRAALLRSPPPSV